ncbi:hypothetical protein AVEN_163197-1 [Araneus ventricosus]|uniref:TIL domain-containing protein n=1 Tax=Araneus ventricosus TaxID=182803 RepID=A0A4Y2I8H0_ARAVE|nr:hypothetical protein AVEN_163197-1 [Araneus ventricosus]
MKVLLFLCAAALMVALASSGDFSLPSQDTLDFYKKFETQHGENTDCTGNHTFYQHTDCDVRCDFTPSDDCGGAAFISCDACKEGYIAVDKTRKQCVKPEDCPK